MPGIVARMLPGRSDGGARAGRRRLPRAVRLPQAGRGGGALRPLWPVRLPARRRRTQVRPLRARLLGPAAHRDPTCWLYTLVI